MLRYFENIDMTFDIDTYNRIVSADFIFLDSNARNKEFSYDRGQID